MAGVDIAGEIHAIQVEIHLVVIVDRGGLRLGGDDLIVDLQILEEDVDGVGAVRISSREVLDQIGLEGYLDGRLSAPVVILNSLPALNPSRLCAVEGADLCLRRDADSFGEKIDDSRILEVAGLRKSVEIDGHPEGDLIAGHARRLALGVLV